MAVSPATVRDRWVLLGHIWKGESYMKNKCIATWQLPVCPSWPWRPLETHCYPKQCLQTLFSQRPEEMALRMHPTPGVGWGNCNGCCRAQRAAVCTAGCGEGLLPCAPLLAVCRHCVPQKKQVTEHPKSGFNALMPFRQIRDLVPGLRALQALMWHSFLLERY